MPITAPIGSASWAGSKAPPCTPTGRTPPPGWHRIRARPLVWARMAVGIVILPAIVSLGWISRSGWQHPVIAVCILIGRTWSSLRRNWSQPACERLALASVYCPEAHYPHGFASPPETLGPRKDTPSSASHNNCSATRFPSLVHARPGGTPSPHFHPIAGARASYRLESLLS